MNCIKLSSISIPNCKTISAAAFFSTNISILSLPKCEYIYNLAFSGCSTLQSLYLLGSSCPTLEAISAFTSTPILDSSYTGVFGSIYVPSSLYSLYIIAPQWRALSQRLVSM